MTNFIFSIAVDMQILVPETHRRTYMGRTSNSKIGRSSLEYDVTRALMSTIGGIPELAHAGPELQASQMWVFAHRSPTFQLDIGIWEKSLLVCVRESQNYRMVKLGRDLLKSCSSTILLSQKPVTMSGFEKLGFEKLQGWRLTASLGTYASV